MQRVTYKGVSCIKAYHTQEYRAIPLDFAAKCFSDKAWLGPGYYFWVDEMFAIYWGHDFKNDTGYFDIYSAAIEESALLNTTFCEEDYFFFMKNINKLVNRLKSNNIEINLKEIHRLLEKEFWSKMGIKGIIYDDLPYNNYKKNRTYSLLDPLYYIKRIQIIAFNKDIIHNFEEHLIEQKC